MLSKGQWGRLAPGGTFEGGTTLRKGAAKKVKLTVNSSPSLSNSIWFNIDKNFLQYKNLTECYLQQQNGTKGIIENKKIIKQLLQTEITELYQLRNQVRLNYYQISRL